MPHFGSSKFERYLGFNMSTNLENKNFCCDRMKLSVTYQCSHDGHDEWNCPDNLLHYNLVFDEYGLIIHDGGTSYITINFCPWCGEKLPEEKRDRWFDELEELGYENPFEDPIPVEYKSDIWYKKENIT